MWHEIRFTFFRFIFTAPIPYSMKKLSLLLAGSLLMFMASCTDDTGDITPDSDARDKFTGDWSCKETINGTFTTFTINISKVGDGDSILVKNFSNYGDFTNTYAEVTVNSVTIPFQKIGVTQIPVSGSGIYSSSGGTDKITMNYNTDGQAATAVCTH